MGVSGWAPMRNSNAFVGNLRTINLSCFVSMTQISWSPKDTHSIPPAWMPSLTLARDQPQGRRPSFLPVHQNSLLRDSPQVMSVTKQPTCIFVFSQSHTWDLLCFYSAPWDDFLRRCAAIHLSGGLMCSSDSKPSVWRLSSHSNWPKSSGTALLKMKTCSLELIRHRQGSYWFYSTSCW